MSSFEFAFSLFGLLLGLALAEVLGGLGTAVQSRRKIHIGWLTPMLGLLVALDVTSFWMLAWGIRDIIPIHYFSLMCGLFIIGLYYLVARITFPHDLGEWPDLDVYYFAHKHWVLGGIITCNLLGYAAEAAVGIHPFVGPVDPWVPIVFYAALVTAMWVKGWGANLAALLFLVAMYPGVGALLVAMG